MDTEELRAYRQNKLNHKIEKWKAMVKRREEWIAEINKEIEPYVSDWNFVTQPIPANSRGRSFRNFKERINRKIDKKMQFYNEIEQLNSKIESAERSGVRVKGDAAKEHQATRDQNDEKLTIGSRVYSILWQRSGEIIKVNQKTYRVKFDDDWTCTLDKIFVEPLNQ